MAQDTPNKSNPLELDNVLTVNGQVYNINATHSDAAAQLDHKLKFQFENTGDNREFDGSEDTDINLAQFMPKAGGEFTGPVKIANHEDLTLTDHAMDIVNFGEISSVLSQLTGHPCFTLTGTENEDGTFNLVLDAETGEEGEIVGEEDNSEKFLRVSLVIGSYKYLEQFKDDPQAPPCYLYLDATDNGSGHIYFVIRKKIYRLCTLADHALEADKADETNKLISETDESIALTADDLYNQLFNENAEADSIIKRITSNETSIDDIYEIINKSETGLDARIRENAGNIASLGLVIFGEPDDNTDGLQGEITSLKNALGNETAESLKKYVDDQDTETKKDILEILTGSETGTKVSKAAAADTATKDSADHVISTYYQKKITISTAKPSGGADGDIWIKYVPTTS